MEVIMNFMSVDFSKCQRKEKEICEGLCLSYDLVRAVCLETSKPCDISMECADKSDA
jgi:hypothetical protein